MVDTDELDVEDKVDDIGAPSSRSSFRTTKSDPQISSQRLARCFAPIGPSTHIHIDLVRDLVDLALWTLA